MKIFMGYVGYDSVERSRMRSGYVYRFFNVASKI